jgi:hypothetical protein
MLTAQMAMEQAVDTAARYAQEARVEYESIFSMPVSSNPQAAATFMAAFMRTAAQDYESWVRSMAQEK